MESGSFPKPPNGLGPRDQVAAAFRAITGELEDLVARMEASMDESGAVSAEDAAQLRDLRLKMEQLIGRE